MSEFLIHQDAYLGNRGGVSAECREHLAHRKEQEIVVIYHPTDMCPAAISSSPVLTDDTFVKEYAKSTFHVT